ncbi:hypothetical protein Cgig2_007332 [Carnegiea gigantea]|uniref:Uncharacterized protein n=1 Tax=Carnegiea gigantea TaxID=171969 RepID=A0A9Q1KY55_9CARY|nr:hypothetical protein Cgig2_007332 [Carnegiea gigantea]
MDRGKIVRRRIKRPDPSVWLAKNLSRACASHNVVEPLPMGEKRLHLRDRWMKRRRRFHQTQEELSSPVADLDLPPPSSTTDKLPPPYSTADNLLPPPHTVAIQRPLSQTVVDLDKVAELPLVTVEDLTPPASTSPTEDLQMELCLCPSSFLGDEAEVTQPVSAPD